MTTTEPAPNAAAPAIPEWTLGWRLQRALAHGDVKTEQIADELGVVRSTVSRWMHDKGAPPRTAYLKQWALRTGVSYEWIVNGSIPERPTGGPTRQYDRAVGATLITFPQDRAGGPPNRDGAPSNGSSDAEPGYASHSRVGSYGKRGNCADSA